MIQAVKQWWKVGWEDKQERGRESWVSPFFPFPFVFFPPRNWKSSFSISMKGWKHLSDSGFNWMKAKVLVMMKKILPQSLCSNNCMPPTHSSHCLLFFFTFHSLFLGSSNCRRIRKMLHQGPSHCTHLFPQHTQWHVS